jgi:hypothetical protein
MNDETGPKSASGVERPVVTEAQKAAVAEVRNVYEAKLAQLEVLHQGRMRSSIDPGEQASIEDEYRREREWLTGERDRKVEAARSSAPS